VDANELIAFRPKNESSAAHHAALTAIDDALSSKNAAVETETQRRPSLLLHGTSTELNASETVLQSSRLDIDQLTAMRVVVAEALPPAIDKEDGVALTAMIDECNSLHAASERLTRDKYEPAARVIASLLHAEKLAADAYTRCHYTLRMKKDLAARLGIQCPLYPAITTGATSRLSQVISYLPGLTPAPTATSDAAAVVGDSNRIWPVYFAPPPPNPSPPRVFAPRSPDRGNYVVRQPGTPLDPRDGPIHVVPPSTTDAWRPNPPQPRDPEGSKSHD
jgi:hypothetical protein